MGRVGGWEAPSRDPSPPCLTQSRYTWARWNHKSQDLSGLRTGHEQVLLYIHGSRCRGVSFKTVVQLKFKVMQQLETFKDTAYQVFQNTTDPTFFPTNAENLLLYIPFVEIVVTK